MNKRNVRFEIARGMPYQDGIQRQRQQLAAMADDPEREGLILLAEHLPVITCGRSGDGSSLLAGPDTLRREGIECHPAGRGGDVTYHGPGQWTVYPVLRLAWFGKDLHRYLRLLEECVIRFLDGYGIHSSRRDGLTGVWLDRAKIAAVGVAVSRWITWHGFALNIHPHLDRFTRFMIPCGIASDQGSVTSLDEYTGCRHGMEETAAVLRRAMVEVLELTELPDAHQPPGRAQLRMPDGSA